MKFDIVFEGGGAKGMAFVGAYKALGERGHGYDRLLGTSAGAIAAVLLAAGYSVQEMQDALAEQENNRSVFASFLGAPQSFSDEDISRSALRSLLREADIPFVPAGLEERIDDSLLRALLRTSQFRHLFSFVERGGWYVADSFVAWMERKLDEGVYNGQARRFSKLSFAQLHAETGVDLTLVAADTADARMLILNRRTAPDCPVVWGARMSMSIPLLWQEVVWQPQWGLYRGKDIAGNTVVDGGLLSGFPIALFVSAQPEVTSVMGDKRSLDVLGLLIDERLALPVTRMSAPAAKTGLGLGSLRTAQRAGRLINTMTQAHDNAVIEAFAHLVVRLPARGYGTVEFDMSEARRGALVDAAYEATKQYLIRLESEPVSFDPEETARSARTADNMAARILDE
ncbi:MAG: patatin-like phospholipase family protein [Chloroflexota bacterium]|nr:patatin-like phospholipase family protein [Chloroflexota bacterium]